ncbi:hypothetical protein GGI42DRAFT_235419 [Trichoderma sp. SZMC 28013]
MSEAGCPCYGPPPPYRTDKPSTRSIVRWPSGSFRSPRVNQPPETAPLTYGYSYPIVSFLLFRSRLSFVSFVFFFLFETKRDIWCTLFGLVLVLAEPIFSSPLSCSSNMIPCSLLRAERLQIHRPQCPGCCHNNRGLVEIPSSPPWAALPLQNWAASWTRVRKLGQAFQGLS